MKHVRFNQNKQTNKQANKQTNKQTNHVFEVHLDHIQMFQVKGCSKKELTQRLDLSETMVPMLWSPKRVIFTSNLWKFKKLSRLPLPSLNYKHPLLDSFEVKSYRYHSSGRILHDSTSLAKKKLGFRCSRNPGF